MSNNNDNQDNDNQDNGFLSDHSIKLTMFQATSYYDSLVEQNCAISLLLNVLEYFMKQDSFDILRNRNITKFIHNLDISDDVKVTMKGKLGKAQLTWNIYSDDDPVIDNNDIGSIQLKLKVPVENTNISVFYFPSKGCVKISGGIPNTPLIKAFGLSYYESTRHDYADIVDAGLSAYLKDIEYNVVYMLLGSQTTLKLYENPSTSKFKLNLLNGYYDTQCYFHRFENFSYFASQTNIFGNVICPEPELEGRRFAAKVYPYKDRNFHAAFDHFGKVQIFSARSFIEIAQLISSVNVVLDMAHKQNVIKMQRTEQKKTQQKKRQQKKRQANKENNPPNKHRVLTG